MNSIVGDRLRRNATTIVSIIATGIWMGALAGGYGWWLPALIFGYVVMVPVTGILTRNGETGSLVTRVPAEPDENGDPVSRHTDDTAADSCPDGALETLRERYARGEITDDQFEQKLQRLVATGSIEDFDNWGQQLDSSLFNRERGH